MAETPGASVADSADDIRDKAIKQLKAKREFRSHLLTYVGVNVFLIAIWAIADRGFFWPVFSIVGWGLFGIVPHAWAVYGRSEITEDQIQQEMRKIQSR